MQEQQNLILSDSEQVERVRKAVLKRGCSVTVGDIMSETGLGNEEAKLALRSLIQTHEGVMRVSENGDMMYVFSPGCILRDQRSWWERNKKTVMKAIKALFKIIIMLVLVIYFIIYLVILIALLTNNRNSRSSGNSISWAIYFFWGRGSDTSGGNKQPLYTRVYNFVFGPEEEEVDPLEARTKCAQLIRAKQGIITCDDWMMISGQSKEKCESDLARFTAEFDGTTEITDNGTLLYVFEDMMKSSNNRENAIMPQPAWKNFELKRPMSGNPDGNGAVIGLNTFNLIMSFLCLYGGNAYLNDLMNDPYTYTNVAELESAKSVFFWLGLFPFIFSCLIFAVPLIRLPFNIKENNARRERNIQRAALASVFSAESASGSLVTASGAHAVMEKCLAKSDFPVISQDESLRAMSDLCDELGGDVKSKGAENAFAFDMLDVRSSDSRKEREKRHLDKQELGRVIFSTDNREQSSCDDNAHAADLDDFDRALQGSCQSNSNNDRSYDEEYGFSRARNKNSNYFSD